MLRSCLLITLTPTDAVAPAMEKLAQDMVVGKPLEPVGAGLGDQAKVRVVAMQVAARIANELNEGQAWQ